ncbi:MAG: ubiquinol-cytochrome c reductase iron-sulfur subunit [Terriglobales bacterium]
MEAFEVVGKVREMEFEPAPVNTGRRRFVQVLLGGGLLASAATFIYPVLRYILPPATTDLGGDTVVAAKVGELKPNTAKIFKFGSRPGLLLLGADGEYRAMSATCTHLSCTVQYRGDLKQVWCACHNGMYDLAGRNVSGPPPRPLELYDVHVRGEEVVVARKREG